MNLVVVSHTRHFRWEGVIYGWSPTVRELDRVATCFDDVRHVAPVVEAEPPPSFIPYNSSVEVVPVRPSGGTGLAAKFEVLLKVPLYALVISRALRGADVVHVRAPANISLVALVLLSLKRRPRYRWVKYAGDWLPAHRIALSYRVQRWWLERRLHRGIVTINRADPSGRQHIFDFHNPCLTTEELNRASSVARAKQLDQPFEMLFVGRLDLSKGVSRLLDIAQDLRGRGVNFRLTYAGDGPAREHLESNVRSLGLADLVSLEGWASRERLEELYARAHVLVLPSQSEGWPKVVSEAMAWGAVPIVAEVAALPDFLRESEAGVVLTAGDTAGWSAALAALADDGGRWGRYRDAGVAAAPRFTYEAYLHRLREVFSISWQIHLPCGSEKPDTGASEEHA